MRFGVGVKKVPTCISSSKERSKRPRTCGLSCTPYPRRFVCDVAIPHCP